MPEIILPTKQQVDSIDKNIKQMLNHFPIQAGVDWRKTRPKITKNVVKKSSDETTVLSISGKGIITNISQYMDCREIGIPRAKISIVVDNSTIFNDYTLDINGRISNSQSLVIAQMLSFSNSVIIKHWLSYEPEKADLTTFVSYVLF